MPGTKLSLVKTLLGDPIRKIPSENSAYLTFDDGPDPDLTPRVLDLLKEYGAKATFFVIAEKAEKHPHLIKRMQLEGHALGNHSLNHRYSPFFSGYKKMLEWIKQSEQLLKKLGINESVGFRPPVGIRTPEIAKALQTLKIPLILWERRCFDRVLKFNASRAHSLAIRTKSGDIVLLHDVQREEWHQDFLMGLKTLIQELSRKGLFLAKLDFTDTSSNRKELRLLE